VQAGATSGVIGELARTIQQEMECLHEATRLSNIVTILQVSRRFYVLWVVQVASKLAATTMSSFVSVCFIL
jgi:hypothetical protein